MSLVFDHHASRSVVKINIILTKMSSNVLSYVVCLLFQMELVLLSSDKIMLKRGNLDGVIVKKFCIKIY